MVITASPSVVSDVSLLILEASAVVLSKVVFTLGCGSNPRQGLCIQLVAPGSLYR